MRKPWVDFVAVDDMPEANKLTIHLLGSPSALNVLYDPFPEMTSIKELYSDDFVLSCWKTSIMG